MYTNIWENEKRNFFPNCLGGGRGGENIVSTGRLALEVSNVILLILLSNRLISSLGVNP